MAFASNGTRMTAILGISAFYHDSAAALVVDGRIVAAAQEERFTRKKHDHAFPDRAIRYCLDEAGLTPEQLDFVGFYDKPLLKFERILETYLAYAPAGYRSFLKAMPLWLQQKLHLPREMRNSVLAPYRKKYVFCEHHESHAASAFFPSPFDEAAILTLDGVGEWASTSWGVGRGNRIEISHELHFPHSLGLLYSAFTYFTGFRVNSGEYKLMGLAPYGRPKYVDLIKDKLLDIKDDGSFWMDMDYFNYCQGLTMTNDRFAELFGGPARQPESELTQREMDIAASIQKVTEEIMLKAVTHVHRETGMKNLVLAGGVALNCVGNGRILRESPFDDIWIQPAAGDAGGALGVALLTWFQLLGNERTANPLDAQSGTLLGPRFSDDETRAFLDGAGAKYRHFDDEDELIGYAADRMVEEKVVGWMQGRMEFGPRALGSRSIIGDARSTEMQSVMNLKIKFRESFRPFAPSVMQERVQDFFEMEDQQPSPYMLLVAPVREERRAEVDDPDAFGMAKLRQIRSDVPGITHVDFSARVQTVDRERHGRYHQLIQAFEERTGYGVVINTSFNVRGEPIVCSPADAYNCFMGTGMDVLVIDNFVLLKEEQEGGTTFDREAYLAQFELD